MANFETKSNIVADGRHRLLISDKYKEQKATVAAEVRAEFQDALAQAGFLRRLFLHFCMNREVAKRANRLAPKAAVYFAK